MMDLRHRCIAWLKKHRRLTYALGGYYIVMFCLRPFVLFLARFFLPLPDSGSVLHIDYMVHEPWNITRILRRYGMCADYLALGTSSVWSKADIVFTPSYLPFIRAFQELFLFWSCLARYEAVQLHFALTPSSDGWEIPALRRIGRRTIMLLAGCEARDRGKNISLHPECNICEDCDYNASICSNLVAKKRLNRLLAHADVVLVTTPDMRDFVPQARHFPFFPPDSRILPQRPVRAPGRPLILAHITNHPGIEGTRHIEESVARLQDKGYKLEFRFLRGVSHQEALALLADADIAIGKMKMGYYANAQIESMALGVPTITWVRPDLMTDELRDSAFIFSSLDTLEETLEYWLNHPEELAARASRARESILALHNEDMLAWRLREYYFGLAENNKRECNAEYL